MMFGCFGESIAAFGRDVRERPEVEHLAQAELLEPLDVLGRRVCEMAAAEEPPLRDARAVPGRVSAQVAEVGDGFELDFRRLSERGHGFLCWLC